MQTSWALNVDPNTNSIEYPLQKERLQAARVAMKKESEYSSCQNGIPEADGKRSSQKKEGLLRAMKPKGKGGEDSGFLHT